MLQAQLLAGLRACWAAAAIWRGCLTEEIDEDDYGQNAWLWSSDKIAAR